MDNYIDTYEISLKEQYGNTPYTFVSSGYMPKLIFENEHRLIEGILWESHNLFFSEDIYRPEPLEGDYYSPYEIQFSELSD